MVKSLLKFSVEWKGDARLLAILVGFLFPFLLLEFFCFL